MCHFSLSGKKYRRVSWGNGRRDASARGSKALQPTDLALQDRDRVAGELGKGVPSLRMNGAALVNVEGIVFYVIGVDVRTTPVRSDKKIAVNR